MTTSSSNTKSSALPSSKAALDSHQSLPKPKGILRNKDERTATSLDPSTLISSETEPEKFDRLAVLSNTKTNAQIHAVGEAILKKNQTELTQELLKKSKKASLAEPGKDSGTNKLDHLKWDEANLYLTEQEKNSTMKITEPKTPYESAAGSEEYYRDDDNAGPLDGELLLGEPAVSVYDDPTIQNGRILKDTALLKKEAEEDAERRQKEETEQDALDQRHKRFAEMRKQHYHMKGALLHQPDQDEEMVTEWRAFVNS